MDRPDAVGTPAGGVGSYGDRIGPIRPPIWTIICGLGSSAGEALTKRAILASIIETPAVARAIALLGVLQVGLSALRVPGYSCPSAGLGIACPGCGLTRATQALLSGEWAEMLHAHAFAPFLLASILLIAVGAVLPADARTKLAEKVRVVEERTAFSLILLISLIIYWLARVVFARDVLSQLVA